MSTWPDRSVPWYLAKHFFWMFPWECFWVRLASVAWKKRTFLLNVSVHQPVYWGQKKTKRWRKGEFTLPDWAGTSVFPCSHPGTYTINSPGSQGFGFGKPVVGLLSLHNCVSQFSVINLLEREKEREREQNFFLWTTLKTHTQEVKKGKILNEELIASTFYRWWNWNP